MKPGAMIVRFLALGLGLLLLIGVLAMQEGLGFGTRFYFEPSAAMAVFGMSLCFTAFAHGPVTLLKAWADIPGTWTARTPKDLERSARVFRTLSRLSILCGWIGAMLRMICFRDATDPRMISMCASLTLLCPLYGHLFSAALCIPFREMLLERAAEARKSPVAPPSGMG